MFQKSHSGRHFENPLKGTWGQGKKQEVQCRGFFNVLSSKQGWRGQGVGLEVADGVDLSLF